MVDSKKRSREGDDSSKKTPTSSSREEVPKKKAKVDKAAAEQAKLDAEVLRLVTAVEPTARPVVPIVGTRADTGFYATFLRSGQGDCIVFKTPGGKVVLIDCGSTTFDAASGKAHDQFIWNSLDVAWYLGGSDRIDIMVFTHPDGDHYNRLASVLDDARTGRKMKVGRVYHSGDSNEYVGAIDWLTTHMDDNTKIFKVTHNLETKPDGSVVRGEISLNGTAMVPGTVAGQVDCLDAGGGLTIVAEAAPACTVTILAGGVTEDYAKDNDTDKGKNRASLVLLVEVYGKKLLLCGDATRSTEHYMISAGKYAAQTKARVTAVDVMHIAHHGSMTTSGAREWLEVVKPKTEAIISAARKGSKSHHLPSWPTVSNYVDNFTARKITAAHDGWCWDLTVSMYVVQQMKIKAPVYITGSHGSLDIVWTR
ncbi:ComEC/Rec2 family competence protein [Micromonospora sp. NPDC050397]|uniref:ComEC/Rec2 family competence protein n=1 Tax=Micromonospora sp. NPDC050397 TaxID=3364279 RepID=UPI00384C6E54